MVPPSSKASWIDPSPVAMKLRAESSRLDEIVTYHPADRIELTALDDGGTQEQGRKRPMHLGRRRRFAHTLDPHDCSASSGQSLPRVFLLNVRHLD